MSEPKVGSFCWLELGTTDQKSAKNFYSSLLGWTAEDMPMSPGMTYTMFRLGGKDVAGGYTLMKDQIDNRVPPHWMPYIRVESADASAAKAAQLGAQQIVPPSDIPHVGRFALLQDPTGAHISIFQPGQHKGLTNFGEVGTFSWADLNTPDPARAARFYSEWLGWTIDDGKDGYRHIQNGSSHEDMIGGIPNEMHAPPGTPGNWMVYFHVADCKATAVKAGQLGGSTLMPAELIEDVGTIGVLTDPQGAVFALYQGLPRS